MIKTFFVAAATFAVLLIANADSVQAQGYLGTPGYGAYGGYGFGILSSPYALGRIPEPPYFALHPPVYYSQPVARTYGYSPFAYPGSVRTPEVHVEMPSAKMLTNPHVTPTKATPKKEFDANLTKIIAPQEIVNPFVKQAKTQMVSFE